MYIYLFHSSERFGAEKWGEMGGGKGFELHIKREDFCKRVVFGFEGQDGGRKLVGYLK